MMSKITKRVAGILALFLATCATGGAWAATPDAVWDGDFTTMTQGNYTLSENGNTKTDTYLQISGSQGVLVTGSNNVNTFTVIVRCSGLNLSSESTQVLFTSKETGPNYTRDNLTGVILPANNAVCRGIWDDSAWDPVSTTVGYSSFVHNSVPAKYTTIIYNHQQTNGTYAYALGPTSDVDDTVLRTTLYSIQGLRSSGSTYSGCAIGGLRGTTSATYLPATGLKITSLAVFSGTLTEDEMKHYTFPSETINVSSDTTVSAIKAQVPANQMIAVSAADGVTITVDEAFGNIVSVSSEGNVILAAASQPEASYFSGVDFSGVQGALVRSWITTNVVGFNFKSESGSDVSGALVAADGWIHDNNSANGTSTGMFSDGLSTLTWASSTTYQFSGSTILCGYLDDGSKNGNGAEVHLANVPYATYDIILYCSSDQSSGKLLAKTVNGTTYTWDSTKNTTVAGNGTWGQTLTSTPAYGTNALRIRNLTGPLTIYGGVRSTSNRGGIAAFEIINTHEATISSAGEYTLAGLFTSVDDSGHYVINVNESATLNIGSATTVGGVTFNVAADKTLTITGGNTLTTTVGGFTVSGEGTVEFDTSMLGGAEPRFEAVDGKIYGASNIGIVSSGPGIYIVIEPEDGVYLCSTPLDVVFARGSNDYVNGTYITATKQAAFEGITLQQFYDGGYALMGRMAGGNISKNGIEATGCNPYVTEDGEGHVASIRYEMQTKNNELKCVVVTLTPNAGGTGIDVVANAAYYAASSNNVGFQFLNDDGSTKSGVSGGTIGSSYSDDGTYALYGLNIPGKNPNTIELSGATELTIGTDISSAYSTLTVTGSGTLTVTGGNLNVDTLSVESGATVVLDDHFGARTVSVASGGKVAFAGGTGSSFDWASLSGAGPVEISSGTVKLWNSNASFTGGITVKNGSTLKPGGDLQAFGPTSDNTWVTVESGGVVDMDGEGCNCSYRIAGVGTGDGALVNNGGKDGKDVGEGAQQTRSIELTADATISGAYSFGMIKSSWNAVKLKFPAEGATLTINMASGKNFWMCNTSRDTSGGNGTINVTGGTLYARNRVSDLSGITLKFNGGTLGGDAALTATTIDIYSGNPCNSYGQSLTATTVNVNNGGFLRSATTTIGTLNVGMNGTATVYSTVNPSTAISVADGGELTIENYNNSEFAPTAAVSGDGKIKVQGSGTVDLDGKLDSFTGSIKMAGGTLKLDTAGFSGKGGVSATADASIEATGATMPIDITGVGGGKTLTVTGAQVDIGTNRPEGTLAFGTGAGTSTLKATFKGASEPEIVVNVSGDLTTANVTAYQPGGTVEETAVNKTIEGGVLTIALANQYPITDSYVDFDDIGVVPTGTATITAEHPVTIGVTTDNVSQLTSRTGGYVNLYASGDGSFTLLFDDNVAAQLDGMMIAGDYTAMFDVGTFTQAGLDTDIAVPADTLYAFTNSTDSAAEYPSVLVVPGTGAVKTVADLEFSATNVFASGATLEVAAGTAEFNFATTGAPETITIDEGATLAISSTALTVANGISVTGSGTLKILDDLTVTGNMTIASGVTLAFADGASLTVTGDFTVSGEGSLAVAPDPTSETSVTLLTVSPGPISGTFTLSAPDDSSSDYLLEATTTTLTLKRSPKPAFICKAYYTDSGIDANSTWFTSWGGEDFSLYSIRSGTGVGGAKTSRFVYHTSSSAHPWVNFKPTGSFSFAIYADVSQVPSDVKAVLAEFGTKNDNAPLFILYRDGSNVKAGVFNKDGSLVGTEASVTMPPAGFHLYVMTLDTTDGEIQLFLDDAAPQTASAGAAVSLGTGFQVGSVHGGTFGTFKQAPDMAVAAMRGYDAVLDSGSVAVLVDSFPATDGNIHWNADPGVYWSLNNNLTYTVYSTTVDDDCYLGISGSTLTIPSNVIVNTKYFRTLNYQESSDTATVNIAGTLNVTSTATTPTADANQNVLFGNKTAGTGTYNITGAIYATNTYLQTVKSAGAQTVNIDGGTIAVKGLYAAKDNSTVNVTNGGTLEVSESPTGSAITYNFAEGTYRITGGDTTVSTPITFSGTRTAPTTIDPYGNEITMAAASLRGSGFITVADSSSAGNGKVIFPESAPSFTGYVVLNDDNGANIDISSYKGKVLLDGTNTTTIARLVGFRGTVIIKKPGTYHARNVDLTGLAIQVGELGGESGIIFEADAGKEGLVTVVYGTCNLYVDNNTFLYEGHIFTGGLHFGTLTYYHAEASDVPSPTYAAGAKLTAEELAVVRPNATMWNLLPYYKIFIGNPSVVTDGKYYGSTDNPDHWNSGVVPADGNVAFKVEAGKTLVVDVSTNAVFNEVQIITYGSPTAVNRGTLVFRSEAGDKSITVTNGIYTASMFVDVEIESGVEFSAEDNAGIHVTDYSTATIKCGTDADPYEVPYLGGVGEVIVHEGCHVKFDRSEVYNLTVNGNVVVENVLATVANRSTFRVAYNLTVNSNGVMTMRNSSCEANVLNITVNDGGLFECEGSHITASRLIMHGTGVAEFDSNSQLELVYDYPDYAKATGDGTVRFVGKRPDGEWWTNAVDSASTGWRGTVAVKDWNSSSTNPWSPKTYGNQYSTLEADNCNVYYFADSANTSLPTLKLAGNLTIYNGSSTAVNNFAGLSGSGNLTIVKPSGAPTQTLRFANGADYTGSITNAKFKLVFGTSGGDNATITVNSGATAGLGDGATWKSEAIKIGGTLDVKGVGTLEVASGNAVTINGGATISLANAPLTVNGSVTLPTSATFAINPGAIDITDANGVGVPLITGITASDDLADGKIMTTATVTGATTATFVVAKTNGEKRDIVVYKRLPVASDATAVKVPIAWMLSNASTAIAAETTIGGVEEVIQTQRGANGCTYIESYALGLTPSVASSVPTAGMTVNGDNFEIFLSNAVVPEGVVLGLSADTAAPGEEFADVNVTTVSVEGNGGSVSSSKVSIPISAATGTQRYRLKVSISGPDPEP